MAHASHKHNKSIPGTPQASQAVSAQPAHRPSTHKQASHPTDKQSHGDVRGSAKAHPQHQMSAVHAETVPKHNAARHIHKPKQIQNPQQISVQPHPIIQHQMSRSTQLQAHGIGAVPSPMHTAHAPHRQTAAHRHVWQTIRSPYKPMSTGRPPAILRHPYV